MSSPPGHSPRGLIRMAGPDTTALLEPVLPKVDLARRGVAATTLTVKDCPLPAVVLVMPGPASYTGDDVVELQLPGSPLLLARIVDELIQDGQTRGLVVRHATAGEFTYRAWVRGRIPLDRAEAVASLIAARNDGELQAARHAVDGATGNAIAPAACALADVLALVEAGIDFADEEDVVAIPVRDVIARVSDIRESLEAHLGGHSGAAAQDSRPRVVLRGPANAGKSTLFNTLLGRQRVVIDEVAGTTRDAIVEPLTLEEGLDILLVDTPGDETEAHKPAVDAADEADVIVWCAPCGVQSTPPDGSLRCATKADLGGQVEAGSVAVSAMVPASVAGLVAAIGEYLRDRDGSRASNHVALSMRQRSCIESAVVSLEGAVSAVRSDSAEGAPTRPEEVAAELRSALDDLGAITGEIPPDDVLGRVFASFCVGK